MQIRIKRGPIITICWYNVLLAVTSPHSAVVFTTPNNACAIMQLNAFDLAVVNTHSTTSTLSIKICGTVTGVTIESLCLSGCGRQRQDTQTDKQTDGQTTHTLSARCMCSRKTDHSKERS